MMEELSYDVRGKVAVVTFDRPEKLNAWTTRMDVAYAEALFAAEQDPTVHAIVTTGRGRGYCAGGDVSRVVANLDGSQRHVRSGPRFLRATILSKPVIAAVNGPCIGVGLLQACTCDVRFVAEDAWFQAVFARRGLTAEEATTWFLPRIVGLGNAMDLFMSGRVLNAAEAFRMGFVSGVADGDVLDHALAYADEIAERCAPNSLAVIKRTVYRHYTMGVGEALLEARALMRRDFDLPDPKEGFASFREKRPPRFPALRPVPDWLPLDIPDVPGIGDEPTDRVVTPPQEGPQR